jgi:hypothetical protein
MNKGERKMPFANSEEFYYLGIVTKETHQYTGGVCVIPRMS